MCQCNDHPTAGRGDLAAGGEQLHVWPMELDYSAYEELFNSGDDAALVESFFAPDCVMVSANGERRGRDALLAFLESL